MLELKLEDTIMIGPDISVQLVKLRGRKVKIGFTAPRGIRIDRLKVSPAPAADTRKSA